MARIVVVVGHSRAGTYCEALGDAYRRGAEAAGHDVSLFLTARMRFDPILRGAYAAPQTLEPDLERAHAALMAADHLVFIFPLWLGTLPAIFKGFLERVLQPELIEAAHEGRFIKPLAGKSVRVIVTMGMPALVYRWYFGGHALKMLKRNILRFLGAAPIRTTIHGSIEAVSDAQRRKWLEAAEGLGRAAR